MKALAILLGILVIGLGLGCAGVSKQQDSLVSRGVYAVSDSIDAGRMDLAEKYAKQTQRVVTPPPSKKRITVNPVVNKAGEKVVVLPASMKGKNIVLVDSTEFEQLRIDSANAKVLKEESRVWKEYSQAVDQNLIDTARDFEKTKAANESLKKKISALRKYQIIVWGVIVGACALVYFRLAKPIPF